MSGKEETIILKLGGSLIYPNGGLDISYIKQFYQFVRAQVAEKNRRFFIIIGGGLLSRHYRNAGAEVAGHELDAEDLDWLGIHATRLNAHLFRTIFRDLAHPIIVNEYDYIQKPERPIVIAAGWKPGWSTDYGAVILAQDYNTKIILKMGNVDHVYNKDPHLYKDAVAYNKISWKDYLKLIGEKWVPGKHSPFDPVAAKLAAESLVKVLYLNGRDLQNVGKALDKKKFLGTVIG